MLIHQYLHRAVYRCRMPIIRILTPVFTCQLFNRPSVIPCIFEVEVDLNLPIRFISTSLPSLSGFGIPRKRDLRHGYNLALKKLGL